MMNINRMVEMLWLKCLQFPVMGLHNVTVNNYLFTSCGAETLADLHYTGNYIILIYCRSTVHVSCVTNVLHIMFYRVCIFSIPFFYIILKVDLVASSAF